MEAIDDTSRGNRPSGRIPEESGSSRLCVRRDADRVARIVYGYLPFPDAELAKGWDQAKTRCPKLATVDMLATASVFASGVLTGIIGAWAGAYFARQAESGRELAERRHRIYLMLLDLSHQHFWISTSDMHKREVTKELKDQFQKAKYEVMDALRTADSLKQLPDVVDVLMSLRFKTETDRAVRLRAVIDELGRGVNPRFLAAAKKADRQNMNLMKDQQEYWERRSKLDPFTVSRAASERLSHSGPGAAPRLRVRWRDAMSSGTSMSTSSDSWRMTFSVS